MNHIYSPFYVFTQTKPLRVLNYRSKLMTSGSRNHQYQNFSTESMLGTRLRNVSILCCAPAIKKPFGGGTWRGSGSARIVRVFCQLDADDERFTQGL
jgi:hypothetical protein